jgi:hypothetical protein
LAVLKLAILVLGVLALAKLGFLDFITGGFDTGRFGGLPYPVGFFLWSKFYHIFVERFGHQIINYLDHITFTTENGDKSVKSFYFTTQSGDKSVIHIKTGEINFNANN